MNGPDICENDLTLGASGHRSPLRVGAVSYLNTKPLIYEFGQQLPSAELVLDLPSRLASRLHSGDLDIALIPSVEFLRSHSTAIVSDACIACRGPVRSVQLLFRCAPDKVRTLALDEGSRTSAALAQVLLAERYGLRPKVSQLDIESDFRESPCDAAVVIGDRAMAIDTNEYVETWDLGEEWHRTTGLPFVFAMWIRRDMNSGRDVGFPSVETEMQSASAALQTCRDQGLQHIGKLAADYAPRYGLSVADCLRYFTEQLHFYLGSQELAGLELFRNRAMELGLLPESCQQLSLQPL